MKIINASLIPVGEKERVIFPLTEILLEGTIDTYNKTIIKRGIPYDLTSLQWEILDVPEEITEIPAIEETKTETPVTEETKMETPAIEATKEVKPE